MKRLIALCALALTACPDWEFERVERCRMLGRTDGACADVELDGGMTGGGDGGTSDAGSTTADAGDAGAEDAGVADAGVSDAGVGDAGTGDAGTDAGVDAGLVLFARSRRLSTVGPMESRVPVFLGARSDGGLYVAEGFVGGYSVWRQPDTSQFGQSTVAGIAACGSGSDVNFVACMQNTTYLSADNVNASSSANFTKNVNQGGVVANFRNMASQLRWVVATDGPRFIRVTHGDAGTLEPAIDTGLNLSVEDVATDSDQYVWWVGKDTLGVPNLMRLPPEGSTLTTEAFFEVISARMHVATAGTKVVAGWTTNGRLSLALRGTATGDRSVTIEAGWALADLVMSDESVVALLTRANAAQVIISRADGTESFDLVNLEPTVLHLGTRLSIAGRCLGTSCTPGANPIDQWDRRPDGGAW